MIQRNSSFSKILQKHPMIVFLSTFIFIFDPLKNLYDTSFGESSFPCRSDIMLCVRPQCVTDFFTHKKTAGVRTERDCLLTGLPGNFHVLISQFCATSSR